MKLGELKPSDGATRCKKRVGRGHGSGLGRNAGRGEKGTIRVLGQNIVHGSKVVRCLCTAAYQNVVSRIFYSKKNFNW